MNISTWPRRWLRSISYRVRWLLLQVYGPATQDDATDPIMRLKRRYGRKRKLHETRQHL